MVLAGRAGGHGDGVREGEKRFSARLMVVLAACVSALAPVNV